jgi:MFS family permease
VSPSQFPSRFLWPAYLTAGFGLALNAMMSFLLPLRAVEFGVGLGTIGLLLGAQGIVEAYASIPVGGFIDRIGPRRAFIAGTAASTVLVLLYWAVTAFWVYFILQILIGFTRPLAWVGAQSYVSSMRSGADRAHDTGRLAFVATGAQIVAPLVVGVASEVFGVRNAFLAIGGYCALFVPLGLVLPALPTVNAGSDRGVAGLRDAAHLLRIPGMRVAMYTTFARLWSKSAWAAFFPLLLVTEGESKAAASTVVAGMALIATALSPTAGWFAKRIRVEYIAAASLGIAAVGLAISPFIAAIPVAYLGAFLVGIGHGLSLPALLVIVSQSAPEDQRGLALGMRSGANQGASAVAPPIVANVIGATSPAIGYPLGGAVAIVLVTIAALTARRHPVEAVPD